MPENEAEKIEGTGEEAAEGEQQSSAPPVAKKPKDRINELLVPHTGQPMDKVQKDTDRNYFMSPEEARDYGLIDKIYDVKRAVKE